jgi:hypothetical protein
VPFVRFSRDKRGYEHVYLVHTSQGHGRSSPSRVLYWYRTPPGVRVGREPFDEEARRALEAEYPNLGFDWNRIVSTPKPSPEVESWRDRRRAERAMRKARTEDDGEAPAAAASVQAAAAAPVAATPTPVDAAAGEGRRKRRRRGGRNRNRPKGIETGAASADLADAPASAESQETGAADRVDEPGMAGGDVASADAVGSDIVASDAAGSTLASDEQE